MLTPFLSFLKYIRHSLQIFTFIISIQKYIPIISNFEHNLTFGSRIFLVFPWLKQQPCLLDWFRYIPDSRAFVIFVFKLWRARTFLLFLFLFWSTYIVRKVKDKKQCLKENVFLEAEWRADNYTIVFEKTAMWNKRNLLQVTL